jgi:DNA polymerase
VLGLFGEAPGRVEDDTLERIHQDLGDCRRCKLWPHRTRIVFGCGNPRAQLVFVGEAPGADEDAQGLPFVGRAGQLLTHWIESLGLKRDDVYISNVIKCRPPGNRSPEKDEVQTCSPFLLRQLDALRPKLICCLGSVALQTLLEKSVSITRMRGQFFDYRGSKLFATFHPAYLLRNPHANREVQADLRKIRSFLSS